jgi:thiol-disulfide isomerase/thioredoxin
VAGITATIAAAAMLTDDRGSQVDALTVIDETTEADGPTPVATDPEALGEALPDRELNDLDGAAISFAQFRGTPLLVNFWASTCPPCLAEMPMLEELSTSIPGIRVIGVNSGESREAAARMIEKTKVTYPQIADPRQELSAELGVIALPTTLLVTADGEIVNVRNGALDESTARQLIEEHLGVDT